MAGPSFSKPFVFSCTSLAILYEMSPSSSCRNGKQGPEILLHPFPEVQALSDLAGLSTQDGLTEENMFQVRAPQGPHQALVIHSGTGFHWNPQVSLETRVLEQWFTAGETQGFGTSSHGSTKAAFPQAVFKTAGPSPEDGHQTGSSGLSAAV